MSADDVPLEVRRLAEAVLARDRAAVRGLLHAAPDLIEERPPGDLRPAAPGGAGCPLKAGLYAAETSEGEPTAYPAAALIFNAAADRLTDAGVRRAAIGEEAIRTLSHLANLTYAPATEESRAKGAG